MTPTTPLQVRAYRFGPASVSGAFGSPFSWLQVAALGSGLYASFRAFAHTSTLGLSGAVVLVVVTAVVVFVPMRGREPVEWLPLVLHAALRKLLRRDRHAAP